MPEQTRTRENLFDVSSRELEQTLSQYMEEESSPEKPAAGLMNPITMIGLGVLTVCAVAASQVILPFDGDFTSVLQFIAVFGGIVAMMTGLGWFTRPKKKKKKSKPVVSIEDVDEFALSKKKRLMKSNSNKRIMGVCGGIAAYFGLDATLVRALFVIFSFIGSGSPVLFYLVLAMVLPDEPRKRG